MPAGLVALLCAASLAACSMPTGLVAIGEPGEVCVPASAAGDATVGLDVLENTSATPVEVTDVSLVDQEGLRVVGWSVVEPGSPLAMVASGYEAPVASDDAGVIPAGERAVLVLGLRLEGAPGTSEGVTVSFSEAGREGTTRTVILLEVIAAGQVCN